MSLPLLDDRDAVLLAQRGKTVWKLGHRRNTRVHRYFRYRIAAFAAIHLFLALVPLTGLFRFDFWRGHHLLFGEPVDLLTAFRRFIVPFGAANVAIVLVVRWTGRYLCGWVCPVNFMNRWGDWLRGRNGAGKSWKLGRRGFALAVLSSLLLAGAFHLWFVDWRVYGQGSPRAVAGALGLWLSLAAVSYLQMTALSWRTCKKYCPSGVYFSILGPRTATGIERNAQGPACEDCGLCVTTCPMELDPRHLLGEARDPQGIYFGTKDNSSLCIRCGDCVEACERYFDLRGLEPTLRMGFLRGSGAALPEKPPVASGGGNASATPPAARPSTQERAA